MHKAFARSLVRFFLTRTRKLFNFMLFYPASPSGFNNAMCHYLPWCSARIRLLLPFSWIFEPAAAKSHLPQCNERKDIQRRTSRCLVVLSICERSESGEENEEKRARLGHQNTFGESSTRKRRRSGIGKVEKPMNQHQNLQS